MHINGGGVAVAEWGGLERETKNVEHHTGGKLKFLF